MNETAASAPLSARTWQRVPSSIEVSASNMQPCRNINKLISYKIKIN